MGILTLDILANFNSNIYCSMLDIIVLKLYVSSCDLLPTIFLQFLCFMIQGYKVLSNIKHRFQFQVEFWLDLTKLVHNWNFTEIFLVSSHCSDKFCPVLGIYF
jgi:hypothetical protein